MGDDPQIAACVSPRCPGPDTTTGAVHLQLSAGIWVTSLGHSLHSPMSDVASTVWEQLLAIIVFLVLGLATAVPGMWVTGLKVNQTQTRWGDL